MTEEPKRLEPTKETIRELFAKSGNICAFTGCNRLMIDEDGTFIGQICHIEGVKGERFNPKMTNEERRAPENLMLMCHEHHIKTNNEHFLEFFLIYQLLCLMFQEFLFVHLLYNLEF